ncbi:MAG: hypothetical protein RL701_4269, partial [Pseudomonadota bacterium]
MCGVCVAGCVALLAAACESGDLESPGGRSASNRPVGDGEVGLGGTFSPTTGTATAGRGAAPGVGAAGTIASLPPEVEATVD